MRNKKLFIKGESAYIGLIISLFGLFVVGVVLILVGINKEGLLQIGIALVAMDLVVCLILFIASLFISSIVALNHEGIAVTTVFNKKLKSKSWSELKNIKIKTLIQTGRYAYHKNFICLYFSLLDPDSNLIKDYLNMQEIYIIADTKKNRRILIEFLPEEFGLLLA